MSTQARIIENEKDIATAAGTVLSQRFRAVLENHTVMYVVNDTVVSKSPNRKPVVVKHLTGRNPTLASKFNRRGTFKLKKRTLETTE